MTATISTLPFATSQDESESRGYVAIVDDDDAVRRALGRLIQAFSFEVDTFPSGSTFIESLKRAVPACLIADLQMDDMTGLELLHRLSEMGLTIPAIVVTARDEPGIQHRCKLRGAKAVLIKPVMADPLLAAIEEAIGSNCNATQAG
jgi:FixJ family two-component response regulator